MRKVVLSAILLAFVGYGVFAEESKKSIEVNISFANDYVFRGEDIYLSKYAQDKKNDTAFNTVPTFIGSLSYFAPIDGLSFSFYTYLPITNREPKTVDYDGDTVDVDGLKTKDEVDFVISYYFENRLGEWGMEYIIYSYPYEGGNYSELGFGYTATKVFLKPFVKVYVTTTSGGDTYYGLAGISYSLKFGNISLEPVLSVGAWMYTAKDRLNSGYNHWSHVDLSIPIFYVVSDNISVYLDPVITYRFFAGFNKYQEYNYENITGAAVEKSKVKAVVSLGVKAIF